MSARNLENNRNVYKGYLGLGYMTGYLCIIYVCNVFMFVCTYVSTERMNTHSYCILYIYNETMARSNIIRYHPGYHVIKGIQINLAYFKIIIKKYLYIFASELKKKKNPYYNHTYNCYNICVYWNVNISQNITMQ